MRKNIRVFYIWAAALSAALMIVPAGLAVNSLHEKSLVAQKLADEIIRFHVRANSDSEKDQELKLKVRDAVIDYLEPLLTNSASIEQSRNIIANNEFGIKVTAQNIIFREGYSYKVNVYFENARFPTRTYGDVTIPAGTYEAYRIDIGEAKGHNWWCVLYPPLCFEDATHAVMTEESKATIQEALTGEEYDMITSNDSNVKVRFKIFKFLNKYFE